MADLCASDHVVPFGLECPEGTFLGDRLDREAVHVPGSGAIAAEEATCMQTLSLPALTLASGHRGARDTAARWRSTMRSIENRSLMAWRAAIAQSTSLHGIGQEIGNGPGHRHWIACRNEQAVGAVVDRLRCTADPCGDQRRAGGHRFQQDVRQRLVERRHDRDRRGRQQLRNITPQPGKHDAVGQSERPVRLVRIDQYGLSFGLVSPTITNRADGTSRATSAAASRNCSRPFSGFNRDTTRTTGAPSGTPSSRNRRRDPVDALEAVKVDAIRDDDDLRRVVAFADQPVLDRIGVHQDAVGELARAALRALLHRGQIRRPIANRRDDDRPPASRAGGMANTLP